MVTIMWERMRELPFIVCGRTVKYDEVKRRGWKARLSFWDDVSRRSAFVEERPLCQCGDEANGYRHEHKRTWRLFGFVTESERAEKSKTERATARLTKQAENTGHWAKGGGGRWGLKILEWCQLYLPVDQGSMGLSGMEGLWARNTKQVQRVYETDGAKRGVKTLERCQVFLLLFWMSRGRAWLNSGGGSPNQMWNFCVNATPVYSSVEQRERKGILTDLVDCNRKKVPRMTCCTGTTFVCKQRSAMT